MTRKLPYISPMDEPKKSGYYRTEDTDSKRGMYLPTRSDIYAIAELLRYDLKLREAVGHKDCDSSRHEAKVSGIRVMPHPYANFRRELFDRAAAEIIDSEYWNQTPESLD